MSVFCLWVTTLGEVWRREPDGLEAVGRVLAVAGLIEAMDWAMFDDVGHGVRPKLPRKRHRSTSPHQWDSARALFAMAIGETP